MFTDRRSYAVLTAAMVIACISVTSQAAELVKDGDFSSCPANCPNWIFTGSARVDTTLGRSGSNAVLVNLQGDYGVVSQIVSVAQAGSHTFSFRYRITGLNRVDVAVIVGGEVVNEMRLRGETNYQQFSAIVRLRNDAVGGPRPSSIVFAASADSGGAALVIDDVSLLSP